MVKPNKKQEQRKIALERIKILFSEAKDNPNMANRYVELARKIAMKVNLRIPLQYKRKYCSHCYNYFNSENSRTRIHKSRVIKYCNKCRKFTRIPVN